MRLPNTGFSGLSKATTKPATPPAATAAPAPKPAPAKATYTGGTAPKAPAPSAKPTAAELRAQLAAAEAAENAAPAAEEQVHDATPDPEPVAPPAPAKPIQLGKRPAPAAAPTPAAAPGSRAVAVGGAFGRALTAMAPQAQANALVAILAVAEQARVNSLYPVLQVSGGEAGGSWVAPDWQDQELNMKLPQGNRPQSILYLGYRLEVLAWPKTKAPNDKALPPIYTAVIPCNDVDTINLMTRATKNYQFKKKDQKPLFDVHTDEAGAIVGPGHPKPTLEIIGFMPEVGLVILRGITGFGPMQKSVANLARHVDPAQNQILPFPATVRIVTTNEASQGGSAWPEHSFDFDVDVKDTGKKLAAEFDAWSKTVMDDQEFMAKFNEWMTGGDRKITDEIRERLLLATTI